MKTRGLRIFGFRFLFLLLSVLIALLFLWLGNFNSHLDNFSFYVRQTYRSSDFEAVENVKRELQELRSYYADARRFKLAWLAEATVFRSALSYEAARRYAVGEFKRAKDVLEAVDDHRAYRINGSADFRMAQKIYRGSENKKAFEKDVDRYLESAKYNFEEALRRGPSDPDFDDQWNYDLVMLLMDSTLSDRTRGGLRRRALGEVQGDGIQIILGFEGGGEGDLLGDQEGEPSQSDDPQAGSSGKPKRRS